MANESKASTKPVQVFRLRGISASVFENRTEQGSPYHKVSIVRTYKDGKDFRTTPTYSRDELPIVARVADQAWAFIHESEQEQRSNSSED